MAAGYIVRRQGGSVIMRQSISDHGDLFENANLQFNSYSLVVLVGTTKAYACLSAIRTIIPVLSEIYQNSAFDIILLTIK